MSTSLNTFDFITDLNDRKAYSTAFDAITQLELWPFMRNFREDSFCFSSSPEVERIYKRIEELGYGGHSGGSFGCVMRAMEYIGKHGIDTFREEYER